MLKKFNNKYLFQISFVKFFASEANKQNTASNPNNPTQDKKDSPNAQKMQAFSCLLDQQLQKIWQQLLSLFLTQDYIYGVNPVMCAIYSTRRVLHELMVTDNLRRDSYLQFSQLEQENYRLQNIVNRANILKLPVKLIHKDKIEKFARNQPHQGVILKAEPLPYVRVHITEHLHKPNKTSGLVWVFTDQVTDPQNFGAIIRAATFLGADGILVDEQIRCPLTPTVSKTSSGALELMEINCVKDSVPFLNVECKSKGWRIISTSLDKKSQNIKEINDLQLSPQVIFQETLYLQDNVIVLLGSEGAGLRHNIKLTASDTVYIATGIPEDQYVFPFTLLDSLNVSVSCGILTKLIKNKMRSF